MNEPPIPHFTLNNGVEIPAIRLARRPRYLASPRRPQAAHPSSQEELR